jgi:hypothetical protein
VYAFAYDRRSSTLVGIKGGEVSTGVDYQSLIDSINQLWAEASATPFATFVLVIDPGQETPSPLWRQRIAEARTTTQPFRIVIVTSSVVMRGVMTAINWIRPNGAGQKTVSRATLEETIAWLEAEGGRARPIVPTLYAKAREQIENERGGAASLRSGSRLRSGRTASDPLEVLTKKTSNDVR